MSREQTDDTNYLVAAGDYQPIDTTDSEMVTLQPRGTVWSGTGVRAERHNDGPGNCWCRCCHTRPRAPRFGPQSGARLKPFRFGLPTLLNSRLPPPRTQPGADFPIPQQADTMADLMDTVARLRNEVYTQKLAPPVPPTTSAFTTTKVQRIDQLGSIDRYVMPQIEWVGRRRDA